MTAHTSSPSLLGDLFSREFSALCADTDAAREEVFNLRFRMFCEELGCELQTRNGMEIDDFDRHSLHCLIRHNATQEDVGCVRLVLPGKRGGHLPSEKHGLRFIDRKLLDWRKLDPTACCEISRLAVLESFRRPVRLIDTPQHIGDVIALEERRNRPRRLPPVVLALYQSAIAFALHYQFEYIFMAGEPRLQRHLATYNITMRQVSPTFEYFGERAVFVATRADFEAAVNSWNADKLDLYRYMYRAVTGENPVDTSGRIGNIA